MIMAEELITQVTDDTFEEEVLKADKPVFIDFWAAWCGPCRAAAPVVDEIASERTDIKVVKVNVDDCPEVSNSFRIMSIPTFIIIKNGKVVGQLVGAPGKAHLLQFIDSSLAE